MNPLPSNPSRLRWRSVLHGSGWPRKMIRESATLHRKLWRTRAVAPWSVPYIQRLATFRRWAPSKFRKAKT